MSEKNFKVFIDFGSSKLRLGIFNRENQKNIITLEEKCISNFDKKSFDIDISKEVIKNLIKSAEKRIEKHINKINLMIDTPDMFSIDISLKRNFDVKKNVHDDIQSVLQEAKNVVQKNYFNKKIIHMIVKKYLFDEKIFYEIPDEKMDYKSLVVEIKFICISKEIWERLESSFNDNYLTIENVYCSSYVRSINYNKSFDNYKKKVIIDIGYKKSCVTIFDKEKLILLKTISLGGDHITKDISKILKIDLLESESIKQSLNKKDAIFSDNSEEKFISNSVLNIAVKNNISLDLLKKLFLQKDLTQKI